MAASSHGATFDLTEVRPIKLVDVHDGCTRLWSQHSSRQCRQTSQATFGTCPQNS
jgi:hypothetical protein